MNKKTRIELKQYLLEEYPRLMLKTAKEMKTQVINDTSNNNKCKKSLKAIKQQKQIGNQLKTHAQALGIKLGNIEKDDLEKRINNERKKQKRVERIIKKWKR